MARRALVGMVMVAAVAGGIVAGCQTETRRNNPYMTEMGRQETMADTPAEVQEFVKASYPDATVETVYEMRHRKEYRMRHFEIHLVEASGRKKVVEYNAFVKTTPNAVALEKYEVKGSGTSPAAQPRGESAGTGK